MRPCAVLLRSFLFHGCAQIGQLDMQASLGWHLCSRQTLRRVHWQCQHNRIFVTLWCRKSLQGEGMVLPFDPMTLTFKDLHYFVEIPKVGQGDTADCPIHIKLAAAHPCRAPSRKLWCILAATLQSGKFA